MRATRIAMLVLLLSASPGAATAQEDGGGSAGSEPTVVSDGAVAVLDIELRVSGEQVDHLSPNRETAVTLTMRNDGEQPIEDGVLRLEPFHEDMRIEPSAIEVGDIAPGARGTATFTLSVTRDACFEPLGIGASIESGGGLHYLKTEIPAVCPGSKVSFWTVRYEGGDGDDVPEPGETLDVWVMLRNDGRDPGRDLTGRLTSKTDGVKVLTGDARWPDIAKVEEREQVESFRIAIDDDVPKAETCGGMTVDGGSAGGDDPVTSHASSSAVPPEQAEDQPAREQTSEGTEPNEGMPKEDPAGEAPAPEPAEAPDPSAIFELALHVQGHDTDLETGIPPMHMCALEDTADGSAARTDDALGRTLATDAKPTGSSGSAARPIAGALVAIVALALALVRRSVVGRPTQP